MSPPNMRIFHALLDPAWQFGVVEFNGTKNYHVSIDHPQHGWVHALVTPTTIDQLITGLQELKRKGLR